MSGHPHLRVAATLEQCWHAVPGGTATSALRQVAALDARVDVDVVGVAGRHAAEPAPAFRPPVHVDQVPLAGRALYEAWHRLRWPKVERATGPVDVVHATGVAVPPTDAPLVVTVHDLAPVHFPELFSWKGRPFFAAAHRQTRRHADLVLCPTAATRDDCAEQGFAEERLRVVPWGVDVPAAPVDDLVVDDVRRRFGLPDRYVLWVGTIEPRKDVPVLLDAFARLADTDVQLVLVGPDGWNEDLSSAVAPVAERCHLTGFVSGSELDALYAGAAVFCLPSRFEGFGMPILEAMAHATPVVTTAGGATGEVAGAAARLVPVGDTEALTSALDELLSDPEAARAWGERGRERARTFTWARCAEQTLAAYREVVA
jgi:glycosyltransferase involved in cell wall biosynthesis